jgi:hypothetical protein
MLSYLDPAAGGMILQAIAGAVAAAAVTVKFYWGRLKRVLGLGRSSTSDDQSQA